MSKTIRIFTLVEDSRGQLAIHTIVKRLIDCTSLVCNCRLAHRVEMARAQKFKGPCNQSSRMQVKSLKVQAKMRDRIPLILVFIDTDVYRDYDEMVERVCMHTREECESGLLYVIPVEHNLEHLLCRIMVATNTVTGSCRDPEGTLSRLLGHKYEKTFADRLAPRLERSLSDCKVVASLANNIKTLHAIADVLCKLLCSESNT
ncbi:hypothetical protein Pyrfu_1228 [Pyrolobus fumarii 1A]|uniref:Uncharacterized protein n=1 Tax=Pyrolobus fumarii (strain DSM 11204 / 1A) TaxID=694429 RepID=G0EFY7_PYRF1|nr:hypothetical protein [Pyrolobus fumarii]AEM39088.1 hypothetical protein Pyrfu_1228 [Pyrolobus fumarii 1A]